MRPLAAAQRWLFRLGRDEVTPIVLSQRRIFILPTRAGVVFAVVLAVMLLGAINYNLSLGHALIFLLGGIGIVGLLHTFYNLFGLQLTPGRAEPVFAGELAYFSLQIVNLRRQPRRALDFSFQGQPVATTHLAGNARATVALPYHTRRRGHLAPGRVTLSTRYPLGLFRAWSYPHPAWSCLVYPQPLRTPLPLPTTPHAEARQGDHGQEDFAGLRPRHSSDPTRHIAWKAVARRSEDQPLLVKQFAGGAGDELWLDWALTAGDRVLEERLSILAGWILNAEEAQIRYGLRLPGRVWPPALGEAHRAACLQALALYGDTAQ